MKIKKNGKVIKLNESDLKRIVKTTLMEESHEYEWDVDNGNDYMGDMESRLTKLEKEVHGNEDAEKFSDRSLQEQVAWLSSSVDELGKSISTILKKINNK